MKIVHICLCGVYTEGWGYQENLLSKYHSKMGNTVTVVANTLTYNGFGKTIETQDTDYVNENKVKVIRLKEKARKPLRKFQRYPDLYNTLTEEKPDVLFVHGCQFLDIKQIRKYKQVFPDVRVYIDNHADFLNSASNWLSKNVLHRIIWGHYAREMLPITEKFYGVLPARVDFLTDVYRLPREKCELLVMGADDELVEQVKSSGARELIRDKHGIKPDDFLVVTGGKINHNRPEMLHLMRAVHDSLVQHMKLIVFGTVSDELKNQFEEELKSEKIQFVGWLDSKMTYEYMAAADLIVFPGLHSVMWEQAVGMGVPCVIKRIPGFDHVDLGGNIAFAEDTSVEGLKNEIERIVLSPKEYQTMKSIAEERGMKAFSYKDIAKRCIEVP